MKNLLKEKEVSKRKSLIHSPPDGLTPWVLKILVELGAYKNFIHKNGFDDDNIAQHLGLIEWISDEDDDYAFNARDAIRQLKRQYMECVRKNRKVVLPRNLQDNISRLSDLLGLRPVEEQILAFSILLRTDALLNNSAEQLGAMNTVDVLRSLAVLLDQPDEIMRDALSPTSRLIRSGLIELERSYKSKLDSMLEIPGQDFVQSMLIPAEDLLSLFRESIGKVMQGHLTTKDFDHLQLDTDIARAVLKQAVEQQTRGVNILIYGPPGTGKTQFSRVLARSLEAPLYQVASENAEGDSISGDKRLQGFRIAQSILADRGALLVFDECEDIFDNSQLESYGLRSNRMSKAWMNLVLEDNAIPCLWLTNDIECIDAAYIRRFSQVIEMDIPPRRKRRAIISTHCHDMLKAPVIDKLASNDNLAPAVVTQTADVVRSIKNELGTHAIETTLTHLVNATLKAQHHMPVKLNQAAELPAFYSLEFINTDTDLTDIISGLKKSGAARLLLYGPPGTGKTALGRWLAEQLDKPLHLCRVSDLVSCYLGDTEKSIARAFSRADDEHAILMLDEVDSLLQDRKGFSHSWETTHVNEMLSQMETYNGILVASTNLLNILDSAAFRRFDLKLHFEYLQAEQSKRLFKQVAKRMKIKTRPILSKLQEHELTSLSALTPGDFAAILRRSRFQPIRDSQTLLEVLKAECAIKPEHSTSIGFVS